MDPLSIAASLAGLITISTQIISIIHTIKSKNNKELDSIFREVQAVRGILCQIQQIIQFQSTKETKNSEWLDALNSTLDDCGDTYLQLQKSLQGFVSTSKLAALKKKVKWTLKEKDIQDLLRKVESYKLSLDLLLSVQTSTTTTNIEDVLIQVQKKLLLAPPIPSAVRTPLSWRKKLAGFQTENQTSQTSDSEDSSSNSVVGDDDISASYIIPGPKTTGWTVPGIFGINQDEGKDAPDLNSPSLVCISEISVGPNKISLFCCWEQHLANEMLTPIRAHILFKGPKPGDLYFIQLEESCMTQSTERFFVSVGKCSLIIARCNTKGSVCPLSQLDERDEREQFHLALEQFALKSSPDSQQVLVNFESVQDRETFLGRLDAVKYLQRMDMAFVLSNTFYRHSPYQKRIQHVQIGYADGTEKSYIYPYLYLDYPVEGDLVMLACSTKPNNEAAVVFKENILGLDFQIVGSEAIVFTNRSGEAIQTISATLGSLDELFHMFHRLKDAVREWESTRTNGVDEFIAQKEWPVQRLEFWKDSLAVTCSFHNVLAVAKVDHFQKRMKMDILSEDSREILASCHVMTSSVLFYKEHFRKKSKKSSDHFVDPVIQGGFWDLRKESATPENYQKGQVRIHGNKAKEICDELEDIVEGLKGNTVDAQKRFLKEIGQA